MSDNSKHGSPVNFHSVYAFLFALAGLLILVDVLESARISLNEEERFGPLGNVFLGVFFLYTVAAALHQVRVYDDLYKIESDEDYWSQQTNGFVGTFYERIIRALVLILILLAFSKATVVFDLASHISNITESISPHVSHVFETFSSFGAHENKTQVYLSFICLSFFLLVTWDLMAILKAPTSNDAASLPHNPLGRRSLLLWFATDFIAFVVWVCLFFVVKDGTASVAVGAALLVFTYFCLVIYRFPWPLKTLLTKPFKEFFDGAASREDTQNGDR